MPFLGGYVSSQEGIQNTKNPTNKNAEKDGDNGGFLIIFSISKLLV